MNLHTVILALLSLNVAACGGSNLEERQAEVAEAGRGVMPFDLEATTHIFEKLEAGGLQRVVADADDSTQIALIRSHLRAEARRFGRGDFADPANIHGHNMPGLQALAAGHDRLSIGYRDIERGAEITYESTDSALVRAIHLWFDAQLRDHGAHARPHE